MDPVVPEESIKNYADSKFYAKDPNIGLTGCKITNSQNATDGDDLPTYKQLLALKSIYEKLHLTLTDLTTTAGDNIKHCSTKILKYILCFQEHVTCLIPQKYCPNRTNNFNEILVAK